MTGRSLQLGKVAMLVVVFSSFAACASDPGHAPSVSQQPGVSMSEGFDIVQGRAATHGLSRFGLVNVFDDHDVRLDMWDDNDKQWLGRLRLKVSDVFPIPAGFLRVQAVDTGGGRAKVSFADLAAPGIPAPEP